MGAPGTGVGQAGIWQAGVEVDPTDFIRFDVEASAGLTFDGFAIAPTPGDFALEGSSTVTFAGVVDPVRVGTFILGAESSLGFAGNSEANGGFDLVCEAESSFTGFERLPVFGDWSLEATAVTGFFGDLSSSYALDGTSVLGFSGSASQRSLFALSTEATLDGFTGFADADGAFALTGEATTRMIWMPEFCPGGVPDVGCSTGPASVVDLLYPSSTLSSRKDC